MRVIRNIRGICLALLLLLIGVSPDIVLADRALPMEPVEIGTTPQFFVDNHVVDNVWALKYKRESVERVFHRPKKHPGNPLIASDGGYVVVSKDEDGRFQMWYQVSRLTEVRGQTRADYAIAYAESEDGLTWSRPNLGLNEWNGSKENNIVWLGSKGRRASSPFLVEVPEKDRRGYRYVFLYRESDGMHLIGSQDGIRWDRSSDMRICGMHSDTQNAIVHDPAVDEYVMYCRAKHIYRAFGQDILDTGESRRIARMTNKSLWTDWPAEPQNILLPDALDEREGFNCFYGMPTRYYGGLFWGFLWPFKMNTDIHTELAWSRDGIRFDRHLARPKLIERGREGAWDDGMVFGGYQWVEVGDEWWMYYCGWDGPHGTSERTPGIGLVTLRKEGFVSLHGPPSGGVVATRTLRWPGGGLSINADADSGEVRVRVVDPRRRVIPGFDYSDCVLFQEDDVHHEVTWRDQSLSSLSGQSIRLEFLLENADLFTFRAVAADE